MPERPAAPPRSPRSPRVLVVDDDPASLDLLHECLDGEGYTVHAARDGARALALAAKTAPDVVLLDVVMDGMDGYEVCRALKQDDRLRHTPILFITARDEAAARLRAFEAGGVDCIAKPFEPEEVRARVRVHVELAALRAELVGKNDELERRVAEVARANERLEREARRRRSAEAGRERAEARAAAVARRESEQWGLGAIVGRGAAMAAVVQDVERLRESDVAVLITGESGTGKELIARALHVESDRAAGPFVAVNCAAIPAELAESVLFGHVKGAFSGATDDHDGYFAAAHGGTLFLDEVGAMPPALQPKLLRALEDGHVVPVGDTRRVPIDARIVSATNTDPRSEIEHGRLRRDLYFRLARYPLFLPPLRERGDDIDLLAEHFLRRFALEMGRPEPVLDPSARRALHRYPFPGNVRELRNMMEHALLRSREGLITLDHIHFLDAPGGGGARRSVDDVGASRAGPRPAPTPDPDPAAAIVAYLRRHGTITNRELRELLSVDPRRASYLLARLVDDGTLVRIGSRRWSRYELA